MKSPRFYHPDAISIDSQISLSAEAAHHCANVLRLRINTLIVLFDGSGKEYVGEIVVCEKRRVEVSIATELALDPQSRLPIHLAQGVAKGDRMEWVLQKATELGVSEITPVISERCNVKLSPERWQKKSEQWHKVIVGACEQCGRNTLPRLHAVETFSTFLALSTEQTRVILSPGADNSFNDLRNEHGHGFRLIIGPEGGLTENELHQASEKGYCLTRMGPRILRTETAALASITALQSRFGDLG